MSASSSSKTVHICRHAQATHNVYLEYDLYPDAALTELGKQQVARLPSVVPKDIQDSIDLIITSPLKRTLQTTKIGWAPVVERLGIKNVVCLPQLQECNAYPCDTGSARSVLEADPEVNDFNFELIDDHDWISKKGQYAADQETLNARAQWVRQYVLSRPEKNILLVGHGDIIRRITAGPAGNSTYQWKNAEVKTLHFDPNYINTPQAFLAADPVDVTAGGWEPTSTEFAGKSGPIDGTASAGSRQPLLPTIGGSGPGALDIGTTNLLAELEGKIAEKVESVQIKTKELGDLEQKLKETEAKKAELEAKGASLS